MSDWRKHDSYKPGVSTNRIVTRSQTGFVRVEKTASNLDLFADASRHEIPDAPHLMTVMKGEYGSIPRTIITRSTGNHLSITEELNEALKPYKDYGNELTEDGQRVFVEKNQPQPAKSGSPGPQTKTVLDEKDRQVSISNKKPASSAKDTPDSEEKNRRVSAERNRRVSAERNRRESSLKEKRKSSARNRQVPSENSRRSTSGKDTPDSEEKNRRVSAERNRRESSLKEKRKSSARNRQVPSENSRRSTSESVRRKSTIKDESESSVQD